LHNRILSGISASALVLLLGYSCSEPGRLPTASDSVPDDGTTVLATRNASAFAHEGSPDANPGEDFDCTYLQEEHQVRFGSPGYVDGNRVGLFYSYTGAPPGSKTLHVFWDEGNRPDEVELFDLGEGEIQRNDDTRFDLTGILEHTYPDLTGTVQRRVRANLLVEGLSGECPAVRRVAVTPDSLADGCSTVTFEDFDLGTSVPLTEKGVTFSGTSSPTTTENTAVYTSLTGSYLAQKGAAGTITISFATTQTEYRFNFGCTNGPTTLSVQAFLGGTPAFSASFPTSPVGAVYEGVASGAGVSYDRLVVSGGALLFAIDNVKVCP
jgi:hypothetical protein